MSDESRWRLTGFHEDDRRVDVTLSKAKPRPCAHCKNQIPLNLRSDARYCSNTCKAMAYYDRQQARGGLEKP